jgi:hypothetical protein
MGVGSAARLATASIPSRLESRAPAGLRRTYGEFVSRLPTPTPHGADGFYVGYAGAVIVVWRGLVVQDVVATEQGENAEGTSPPRSTRGVVTSARAVVAVRGGAGEHPQHLAIEGHGQYFPATTTAKSPRAAVVTFTPA